MSKYPVQFTWVDASAGEAGTVAFVSAKQYHEDLAHACSQGLDEVMNITPLTTIPEDY